MELRHGPNSVLDMDERSYFLPNVSNIVIIISELRKEGRSELLHVPISAFHVDEAA